MTDLDRCLRALAQYGVWFTPRRDDVELLRVELRHAARAAGLRIVVTVHDDGSLAARSIDGLPGCEPWRHEAVTHYRSRGDARR